MLRVIHILRKKTQLYSSFIYNQLSFHDSFCPFVLTGFNSNSSEYSSNFKYHNIEIFNLNFDNYFSFKYFYFLRLNSSIVKQLNLFIDKIKPDIIHLHYGSDSSIFLPYIYKSKIPTFVSFYGYDCTGFPSYYFGLGKLLLKYKVFKNVTFIAAMSDDMKQDLIKIGCPENKVIVHYHGINIKPFVFNHSYIQKSNINLLIISGFTPQKGHFFLLQSFRKALLSNKDISLTIVGEGKLENEIKKFIINKNISNVVVKPSVIFASEEHINYLKNADIFIHPSITDKNKNKEGIPGSIAEAMSSGLPVISTFHAGIPSIIQNNVSGLLVQENDIDALSEAILKLADNVILREQLGSNAKKFALENLNIEKKEKELEDIYLMAINMKKQGGKVTK